MNLSLKLTTSPDCFVSLPAKFSQLLFSENVNIVFPVPIRLSWQNKSGKIKDAFVGWPGSASDGNTIEINQKFATLLELCEFYDGNYYPVTKTVKITVISDVPIAEIVEVEPNDIDDWEILELHSQYLEEQILNQISITYVGECFPIHIYQHTVIKLRTVNVSPKSKCIRLQNNSEIIVAPKPRNPNPKASSKNEELEDKQIINKCILKIKPNFETNHRAAFVSENTFKLLKWSPGDLISVQPLSNLNLLYENKLNNKEKQEEPDYIYSTIGYCCVYSHKLIEDGMIYLPQDIQLQLKSPSSTRVRVSRNPTQKSISPKNINFYTVQWKFGLSQLNDTKRSPVSPAVINDLFDQLLNNIKQSNTSIILSNGSILSLNDKNEKISFIVNFDGESSTDAIVKLNTFSPKKNVISPFDKNIPIQVPSNCFIDKSLNSVGGFEKYCKLVEPMFLSILSNISVKKTVISTPLPPLFIISGNIGSGKTTLARHLCKIYENLSPIFVFSISIDFKDLVNRDIGFIRNLIESHVQIAKINQPSILFLEDLDSVVQVSQQGELSLSSEQLIEFLVDQFNICAEDNENIAFITTLKNYAVLPPSIKSTRITNTHIDIKAPNAKERLEILKSLAVNLDFNIADTDLSEIISETEGYFPIDLKQLIERASHFSTGRNYSDFEPEDILKAEDFNKAIQNFTPVSLKGVKLLKSETTWEDVGGMENIKLLLKETFEWPSKYQAIFAKCPLKLRKGVLLYGPPGCGKTFIAGVVAKECGLNFISIKGPELLNKYIGASEQAVRDLFDQAAAASPCILFFDEFDSIAPRRGHDNTGVTDRVVNQLLTQLDGVESYSSVYVLAATSRPDLIDPALLRPGRLDKSVYCGIPGTDDRKKILCAILRKLTYSLSEDFISDLAEKTDGYTGADLQALIYNAQLEAVHNVIDNFQSAKKEADAKSEKHNSVILTLGDNALTKAEQLTLLKQVDQLTFSLQHSQIADPTNNSPVIVENHVEKALSEFRPSVSASERRRYESIYEDFLDSRGAGAVPMSDGGKKMTQA